MKVSFIISLLLIINVITISKTYTNNLFSEMQNNSSQGSQNQPTPEQMIEKLKQIKKKLFNNENFNTSNIRAENKAFHLEYSSFHFALSNLLAMEDFLVSSNIQFPKEESSQNVVFPQARPYEKITKSQQDPQSLRKNLN